jgi:hypothetical protein
MCESPSLTTAELCCVLGQCGKPALPALLGRGINLAGPSGYWVGHSSGSFAVELMSDREPGPCARLPRITSAQIAAASDGREGRGDSRSATSHAADRSPSPGTSRSALRVVAPRSLFSPGRTSARLGALLGSAQGAKSYRLLATSCSRPGILGQANTRIDRPLGQHLVPRQYFLR